MLNSYGNGKGLSQGSYPVHSLKGDTQSDLQTLFSSEQQNRPSTLESFIRITPLLLYHNTYMSKITIGIQETGCIGNQNSNISTQTDLGVSIQDFFHEYNLKLSNAILEALEKDPLLSLAQRICKVLGREPKEAFGATTGIASKFLIGTSYGTTGRIFLAMCNTMYLSIAVDRKDKVRTALSLHGAAAALVHGVSVHQDIALTTNIKAIILGIGLCSVMYGLREIKEKEMAVIAPCFLIGSYLLTFAPTVGRSCFFVAHVAFTKLAYRLGLKATRQAQAFSAIYVLYKIRDSVQ